MPIMILVKSVFMFAVGFELHSTCCIIHHIEKAIMVVMRPQLILLRYFGCIIIDFYLLLFLQGIKPKHSHLSSLVSFQRK